MFPSAINECLIDLNITLWKNGNAPNWPHCGKGSGAII